MICRVTIGKGTRVFAVNPPEGETRWGCERCAVVHARLVAAEVDQLAPGSVWRRRRQKRRRD